MIPRDILATAQVPDGEELQLISHGSDFMIVFQRNELMSTRMQYSEEQLAIQTMERLDMSEPRMLIGGYGMGFTLRAALRQMGPKGEAVVAELMPEIIEWGSGPDGGVDRRLPGRSAARLEDMRCGGADR